MFKNFLIFLLFSLSISKLTVHLIPHSHIDHGWIKTVDDYFEDVSEILDSIIVALQSNHNRTFIWSEVYYFKQWYSHLNSSCQQIVKDLIHQEQLIFVHSALVSSDESLTTADSTLLQHLIGQKWLKSTFNCDPSIISWQIDPFGHSSMYSSISEVLGYKLLVINRIHFHQKKILQESGNSLFIWENSNFGSKILTYVLDNHYSSPSDFDFERNSWFVNSKNLAQNSEKLIDDVIKRSKFYPGNDVMILVGDDFRFKNATYQYHNWDQLINFVNQNSSKVFLKWSCPQNYYKSIINQNLNLKIFNGNFHPYSDLPNCYWTGFFSTRPFLKFQIRQLENFNIVAKYLKILSYIFDRQSIIQEVDDDVDLTVSLMQHHDAITGTSRQLVINDYFDRLDSAITTSITSSIQSISTITKSSCSFYISSFVPSYLYVINIGPASSKLISFAIANISFPFSIETLYGTPLEFTIKPTPVCNFDEKKCSESIEVDVFLYVNSWSVTTLRIVKISSENFRDRLSTVSYFYTNNLFNFHSKIWFENYGKPFVERKFNMKICREVILHTKRGPIKFDCRGMIKPSHFLPIKSSMYFLRSFHSGAYVFSNAPTGTSLKISLDVFSILKSESNVSSSVTFYSSSRISLTWVYNHMLNQIRLIFKGPPLSNAELFLRFEFDCFNVDDDDFDYLIHDSLSFSKITVNQNDSFSSRIFPSVFGAGISSQNSSVFVKHSNSIGVSFQKNSLDFLMTRHSMSDDYKGMGEGNNDSNFVLNSFLFFIKDEPLDLKNFEFTSFAVTFMGNSPFLSNFSLFNVDCNSRLLSLDLNNSSQILELIGVSNGQDISSKIRFNSDLFELKEYFIVKNSSSFPTNLTVSPVQSLPIQSKSVSLPINGGSFFTKSVANLRPGASLLLFDLQSFFE
ncbi:hypothetical protein RCL1_004465 [Eukaryota sp. TZLM3-RCL]